MEIIPGLGVALVKIGDQRSQVEEATTSTPDSPYGPCTHWRHVTLTDPAAGEDDERAVSEAVSVAPYSYFVEG
ncbi:hypothetical protein [Streptomyces sp. NBC_01615]|uniref:hypothetical protein n=1 Tax=Streptomyces sp. NBC_01615 TaxID=2975898 RepID=UPI00386DCFAF